MMSKPFFLAVCAWTLGAAVLMLSACSREPEATKLPPPDQIYTTSGVIDALPGPRRGQYLRIHHERIPEFVDESGAIVGMREMVMDFEGVDPAVDLTQFRPGDKVEFTFEVRWNSEPLSYVTSISKLPPDITLDLSELREPDADAGPTDAGDETAPASDEKGPSGG